MYTKYFGLKEKPFDLSPDPKFLYLSEAHREAFAHLKYGVQEKKGFVVITGDVGTGKTTLLNALLQDLDPKIKKVHLTDPGMTAEDLFYMVRKSLDFPVDDLGKGKLLWDLSDFMNNKLPENERVLLIVDEAQRLSPAMLEEIRLLSNVETPNKRLFQIFLVGQQELNGRLQAPELRQLRQRVGVKYHLTPLNLTDTQKYIQHRLKVAGFGGADLFHKGAIRGIHSFSRGYPRLINVLCDNSLINAYSRDLKEIRRGIVKESIKDIKVSYAIPQKRSYAKAALATMLVFLLAGLTYGVYNGVYHGTTETPLQGPALSNEKPQLDSNVETPMTHVEAAIQQEERTRAKESSGTEEDSRDVEQALKDEERKLAEELKQVAPPPKSQQEPLNIKQKILFDYNDYEVRPEATESLREVAAAIHRFPQASVVIEGHTDNSGDNDSNKLLSEERAEAVKRWLVEHAGIEESRLKITAWGDAKPLASNDTAEGRKINRRVEIIIER